MKPRFSLRLVIPVLTVILVVGTFGVSMIGTAVLAHGEIRRTNEKKMKERLNFLQGMAEAYLRLNFAANLQQMISIHASEPDLLVLFLADANDTIIASSKLADTGNPWVTAYPEIEPALVQQVSEARVVRLETDERKKLIHGIAPVCAPALEIQKCGFIYYRLDLEWHYRTAREEIVRESALTGSALFAGALLLWLALTVIITKRTEQITKSLNRFSAGERGIRMRFQGVDEIAVLGRSLNDMFRKVESGEVRLKDREARLRTIVESAFESIITIDFHGSIQSVNPATEKLFGYAAAELIGQNVKILMPEPYSSKHVSAELPVDG